jgi:hypothetical protein
MPNHQLMGFADCQPSKWILFLSNGILKVPKASGEMPSKNLNYALFLNGYAMAAEARLIVQGGSIAAKDDENSF